jgi:hypothetical protein
VEQPRTSREDVIVTACAIALTLFGVLAGVVAGIIELSVPMVLVAIGLWAFSLHALLYDKVLLYNAKSHTKLQRTTFAGKRSLTWTQTKGTRLPIHFHFERSPPAADPASITILAAVSVSGRLNVAVKQAAALFRAALIDLLAKEYVQVYLSQSYVFRKGQSSPSVVGDYIIVATQSGEIPRGTGRLESKILLAIDRWRAQPKSKEWMDGPPIYNLVCSVDESGKTCAPASWLAELVADDACSRGLGAIKRGFLSKRIEWDAARTGRFGQEQQSAQALSQRLFQMHPNFSRVLDQQIVQAIESMARVPPELGGF